MVISLREVYKENIIYNTQGMIGENFLHILTDVEAHMLDLSMKLLIMFLLIKSTMMIHIKYNKQIYYAHKEIITLSIISFTCYKILVIIAVSSNFLLE